MTPTIKAVISLLEQAKKISNLPTCELCRQETLKRGGITTDFINTAISLLEEDESQSGSSSRHNSQET